MDHSENRHALGWGGRLSLVSVTTVDYGPSLIRRHKRRLQGLRVWDSIHFGYYFYASRGDIFSCEIFGELRWIGRKSRRTLKRIEPGSEPLLNETPPTLQLCPARQNCRVDFRTRSAQTHVCSVSCGGRTERIHGLWACGIVGSTGNRRWLVFWPYTMGIDRTRTCLPHDGG